MVLHRMYPNVAIPKTCMLRFEVWDEDPGEDDFLGAVHVEFDPIKGLKDEYDNKVEKGFKIIELQLKDKHGKVVKRKKNGQVSKLELGVRLHDVMADMDL